MEIAISEFAIAESDSIAVPWWMTNTYIRAIQIRFDAQHAENLIKYLICSFDLLHRKRLLMRECAKRAISRRIARIIREEARPSFVAESPSPTNRSDFFSYRGEIHRVANR